jgi:PEP-CTERM motif-containing protein
MTLLQRISVALVFVTAGLVLAAPRANANSCDLYTTSASCGPAQGISGSIGSALYQVVGPQPTGTGVIDSFLRIEQKGTEEGFNTSERQSISLPSGTSAGYCDGVDCDSKTDPNYTHDLLTSKIPTVVINGQTYREFFLDINEPAGGAQNLLTLDQVEIYQSGSAGLSTHLSSGGGSLTGATKIYDLDGGPGGKADNWINLDYTLIGGGSGSGDMVLFVLDTGQFNQQYTYLYSQFGCASCGSGSNTKYASQAGFEEWWVPGSTTNTAVPEPATLLLLGSGLLYVGKRYRQRA